MLFFFRKGITAILCTIKGTLRILFLPMQDKSADNLGSVTNVPLMVHVPKKVHSGEPLREELKGQPETIDGIAEAKQRVSVSIRGNARFKI